MSSLLNKIFNQSQTEAIQQLWEDKSSRKQLERQIGIELLRSEDVIDALPVTQIMLLTSLSSFASSSQECYDVGEIIIWGIKKEDILPSIVLHRQEDLAYRCLLSLGFFKKELIRKWNRHSAPSPDFYRKVGVRAFSSVGKNDIGSHFYQWEVFMSELFN